MDEQNRNFFERLRERIDDWAKKQPKLVGATVELVLLAPDMFYLLARLVVDPEVPAVCKVKLAAVIAYFVSPVDLVPEALTGPLGYADDVVLAALTLNDMLNHIDQSIIQRHWKGSKDLLTTIQHVLSIAEAALGLGILGKLRKKAE